MTDWREQPAPRDVDVAILGGGLSGGLCVLALAEHAPHLRVALVEQGQRIAGNHTWCCHGSDLAMTAGQAVGEWFRPVVQHRWAQYQVAFPDFTRTMGGAYLCVPAESLQREVTRAMARPGTHLMLAERVQSATSRDVRLESGSRLRAKLVIDARGSRPATSACGYQKFLGWEIETDEAAPELGRVPTLMDARVQQLDGYRFVYVLPMSSTRFLVEDTYFSRAAVLDRETVSGRLRKYLAGRGVQAYAIVREEGGVLPMPWSARGVGDATDSAPVAIGYRAELFHPATGYSLGLAAQTADRIARSIGAPQSESLPALASQAVANLQSELATNLRFARALNFLAFRTIPGSWLRSLVFSAVYRLPPDVLQRFYAAQANTRDRLALLGAVARVRVPRPRLDLTSTHLNGETP
jgi:lycopene beta-cyclase